MTLELSDIQGIVLYGYASMPHARYVHISFAAEGSEPVKWLSELREHVHGASGAKKHLDERINVAFTHRGIARFALDETELASFPRELQQGMNAELRAHVLGDVEESDPTKWEFGARGEEHVQIDALLLLYAKSRDTLALLRDRLVLRLTELGGSVLHEDFGELSDPLKEPFGFRDGIMQPYLTGSGRAKRKNEVEVPAGEFVLGYPNAYDELPASPRGTDGFDLGKNGSYLVYRKLKQDTSGFWKCMLDRAEPSGDLEAATKLASSMVGRWPSGAPLVRYPNFDPGEQAADEVFEFFAEDPDESKCPLGAHIRRANPRDMLGPSPEESRRAVGRHRLLRRGRPYGPPASGSPLDRARPDDAERGLVFLALNVSFRRQFEFVQQTWVNNPKFGNLYDERDPLVSSVVDDGVAPHFSIPGDPARRRVSSLPKFVTLRGGAYFFLPSLRALSWLAERQSTIRETGRHEGTEPTRR